MRPTFYAHKAKQQGEEYLKVQYFGLYIALHYKAIYIQDYFNQGSQKIIYFSDFIFYIHTHVKFYFL